MTVNRSAGGALHLRWMRLALLLFSLVLALLVVEAGVRIRQWVRYGRPGGQAYELVVDPASGLRIPKPGTSTSRLHIDSRGFRNPELETPKPAGRIRLAFLGASTTFCAEVSGDSATWPYLVCRALRQRYPGASFDFVNAAAPGFGIQSTLRNLHARVAAVEPDFIMYYEATNDFTEDTRRLAREQGLFSGKAEDPSPLARISAAWYLVEKNLTVRNRQRGAGLGHSLVYSPDSLAQGFESRLVGLLGAMREVAPVCAVATFSHKVRRDQPPAVQLKNCNTSLYYAPYLSVPGFLDGWDAYNRAIRAAARESGAILIGGEDSIPGDDQHFADSVHFLDAGARAMAERVTATLVASPEFNRMVEARREAATPR